MEGRGRTSGFLAQIFPYQRVALRAEKTVSLEQGEAAENREVPVYWPAPSYSAAKKHHSLLTGRKDERALEGGGGGVSGPKGNSAGIWGGRGRFGEHSIRTSCTGKQPLSLGTGRKKRELGQGTTFFYRTLYLGNGRQPLDAGTVFGGNRR